jgi:hypothetical protein
MGSTYDFSGRRWDISLFLDYDGRYERVERREPDYEQRDAGRWDFNEADDTLRLTSDEPDSPPRRMSGEWWVLAVTTCESSNVLLVLREAKLASRNLPILFYRVHNSGRGYGTDWEKRPKDTAD